MLIEENENQLEEVEQVLGPLSDISRSEVVKALSEMKSVKASGPSHITAEMMRYSGGTDVGHLTRVFRKLVEEECVSHGWSENIPIRLYRGKGESLICGKYRGLRLLEHSMKIWERLLIKRLKVHNNISGQQRGFVSGKSTTDAFFTKRQLVDKYFRKKKKQLYHIFVDLEKPFDKVPRAAIQWELRRQQVPEKLVRLVMVFYTSSTSRVRVA